LNSYYPASVFVGAVKETRREVIEPSHELEKWHVNGVNEFSGRAMVHPGLV
jgi:hypothetical protein